MGKSLIPPPPGGGDHIEPIDLKKALEERYLAYALSTIMHRALPDVRDGLKPVHRRIMHAMRLLRLNPDQGFAKCARIVGEVMGKFHPHGDQSIYDALVRLAQDFAVRYPLVDGQGNFGNVDGDNAAAMRYTEARMTEVATELLSGIGEDAVDFRPTYNEEDEEPVVLPGAFPNILANGASGIAVGMATSIPPHNAAELLTAALHLVEYPDASVQELMTSPAEWAAIEAEAIEDPSALLKCKVRGPDFPTGGVIVDDWKSIVDAYETGRGSFRLRAVGRPEDHGRGTWNLVVTEIPYQVQKARLIEKIAEFLIARKLPLLEDVRDESAEDIRLVLVPKSRSVDPSLLLESLFRLTELETRFPLNMNVLSRGRVPNVLSLRSVLREWLDHRKDVLVRRSRHRLGVIERRLEILAGYLVAYLNIDEVIRIIREEDEPRQEMMARWSLTEVQAEAILNMRLRALRKLEEIEIRKEFDALSSEKAKIESLLASDARQWKTIAREIRELRTKFGPATQLGRRRTQFADAPTHDVADIHNAMIEKEPVTVVISEKGWLRAMKGHLSDLSQLSFKEGDGLKLAFPAYTTDKILIFTTGGKFHTSTANLVFILAFTTMFSALLSWIFLGERPAWTTLLAMAVMVLGVLIIVSDSVGTGNLFGDFMALCSALLLASAITISRASGKDMGFTSLVGVILPCIIAAIVVSQAGYRIENPAWILFDGAVIMPISFFCLATGPRYLSGPEVAMFYLLETVLAPIWVWVIFAETPSRNSLIGGSILIVALVCHSVWQLAEGRRRRATAVLRHPA